LVDKKMGKYISTVGWFVFVTTSIGMAAYGLTHGWGVGPTLMAQGGLAFVVCAIAETVVPFRRDWRWVGDRQVFTDLGHVLLFDQSINNLYAIGTIMVITYLTPANTTAAPVVIALGVVYLEISEYWRHRFLHASEKFWPFHALHHHLDRMHVFRSGRVHFFDGCARVVFTFLPALLLGVPVEAITWWAILLNATGPISHSNLNIHTPKFFNWIVATPMVHRVHHASADQQMRSNLAPVSPLVDRLFNTWLAPEDSPVVNVGVKPDPLPASFLGQLATPFVHLVPRSIRDRKAPTTQL
jgi:sterol desaturase/sphingolipid hydroxylase (fatty acid hydroxylase superfamily)